MPRHSTTPRAVRALPLTLTIALAVTSTALGGCQIGALLLGATGERVKAEYKLPDRTTLVMVEDPDEHLGDPSLTGVVARKVENQLEEYKAFDEGAIVPQQALREVANELGDDYARAPIDRIGRLADAEQVIHVAVRSVRMMRAVNVYEPTASVEVKLIDTTNSRRLFPEAGSFESGGEPVPGHVVTSSLEVSTADRPDQGTVTVLSRQLAERIGRDVARVFHHWQTTGPRERER